MNFFNMPKPRRFSYQPIYSDEREERLRRLEERAGERMPDGKSQKDGRDAGDCNEDPARKYGLHFARRKRNAHGSMLAMGTMQILVIIIVLVAVWRILLSL